MLIRKAADLTYVDVTPKQVYLNRRRFLEAMGIVGATAIAGRRLFELAAPSETALAASKFSGLLKSPFSTTEKENSYQDVTHYNNFYEFGTGKEDPAKNAQKFDTSNWMVSVEGDVSKPRKFSMDEILKIARSRSACTAIAAWKRGPSWFPGLAFRSAISSTWWNQLRKRRSSHSTAITIPARCPRASGQESSFLMSKACAWTRR